MIQAVDVEHIDAQPHGGQPRPVMRRAAGLYADKTRRNRLEESLDLRPAELTADHNVTAEAVRGHWGIENKLHWVLDVVFGDDQARLRKGNGAKNMAVVRHFAINLVRAVADTRSIKLRRKAAGWDVGYLATILRFTPALTWIRCPATRPGNITGRSMPN